MESVKIFWRQVKSACRIYAKNPLFILSSFLVDLLFFFLFGLVYSFLSMGVMERLVQINSIIGEVNAQIASLSSGIEDQAALTVLSAQQQALMEHLGYIAMLAAGIVISTYILWCIFQGISWHLASWVSHGKKTHFMRFLGKFSLLNLVWLFGFVLVGFATYQLSVYNAMAKIMLVSQNAINYFMLFLVAVLLYFAVVSYSFAAGETFWKALENAFVFGFKRAKFYIPAYLLVALKLSVIYIIISLLKLGLMPSVLLNLLFMLPVFAYGRVLFLQLSSIKK